MVAPEAPGVKARVFGTIYRGGHFRVEANVEASAGLVLHLSLPEPCALAPGAPINVAVDDGWIIPEAAEA